MTRSRWIILGVVFLVLCGTVIVLRTSHRKAAPLSPAVSADIPAADVTTLSLYSNGEFGFSLAYPSSATRADAPQGSWRYSSTVPGTPVVSFTFSNGRAVHIGASSTTKALATCVSAGPAETKAPDTAIGSILWKTFTFDRVGTDNTRHLTSYRTVHNGTCFALETDQAAPASADADIGTVVSSFSFAANR